MRAKKDTNTEKDARTKNVACNQVHVVFYKTHSFRFRRVTNKVNTRKQRTLSCGATFAVSEGSSNSWGVSTLFTHMWHVTVRSRVCRLSFMLFESNRRSRTTPQDAPQLSQCSTCRFEVMRGCQTSPGWRGGVLSKIASGPRH